MAGEAFEFRSGGGLDKEVEGYFGVPRSDRGPGAARAKQRAPPSRKEADMDAIGTRAAPFGGNGNGNGGVPDRNGLLRKVRRIHRFHRS
jgi:hypothetical protein